MTPTLRLALGSIAVGVLVLLIKLLAWWLTDSVALLSDALESTVNVAAAIAAFFTVRFAALPPDTNHPYGHHKAEYFSAVLEGVLIIVAALLILHQATMSFLEPEPLEAPLLGLMLTGLATGLNFVWSRLLIRRGTALRSPALVADGRHLFADVVTSLGVGLGIVLTVVTGWLILDPIIAVLVAAHILWSGIKVVTSSLSGLMDEAVSEEVLAELRAVISREADGALEAHALLTRQAGPVTFIDFHLVVDGQMSVFDAHEICDRLEAALMEAVPGAKVTIHLEPEHKAEQSGIVVLN